MNAEKGMLRGTIDALEAEWARLALDDGQRLDWPRDRLPPDASEGMAFVLFLGPQDLSTQEYRGVWLGTVGSQAQAETMGTIIHFGSQSLSWPTDIRVASGDQVAVQLKVDVEDTARRREEAKKLISDLFG